MVAHYFGSEVTAAERERLDLLLPEEHGALRLTPAAMEQLCAEHETVGSLLDSLLERMSGPMLVPARAPTALGAR